MPRPQGAAIAHGVRHCREVRQGLAHAHEHHIGDMPDIGQAREAPDLLGRCARRSEPSSRTGPRRRTCTRRGSRPGSTRTPSWRGRGDHHRLGLALGVRYDPGRYMGSEMPASSFPRPLAGGAERVFRSSSAPPAACSPLPAPPPPSSHWISNFCVPSVASWRPSTARRGRSSPP